MNTAYRLVNLIDSINQYVGTAICWVSLLMVVTQFSVVLLRYVFGIGSIWLQEGVIYFHSILFTLGAASTLLHGGHVRVDIFYRDKSDEHKALVDLVGSIGLLLPVCILIIYTALPYVDASWRIMEASKETSGIPAVYLLKSLILVMGALLSLQGLSMALRSILILSGHPVPPAPQQKADHG